MARQFLGICPHRKVPTIESGSKNAKVLREFFLYAESHPGYRFWQALAGFTGGKQVLLWKPPEPGIMLSIPRVGLEDPFYYEGKDK